MPASILTTDDLQKFKKELLEEIKHLLQEQSQGTLKNYLKSGKFMELLKISPGTPHKRPYEVISCRIKPSGSTIGDSNVLWSTATAVFFCFDDLGVETTGRFFGQDCNVPGEILLSRFELFQGKKIKTHLPTNFNAVELEGRYGNRVRSRMH